MQKSNEYIKNSISNIRQNIIEYKDEIVDIQKDIINYETQTFYENEKLNSRIMTLLQKITDSTMKLMEFEQLFIPEKQ